VLIEASLVCTKLAPFSKINVPSVTVTALVMVNVFPELIVIFTELKMQEHPNKSVEEV